MFKAQTLVRPTRNSGKCTAETPVSGNRLTAAERETVILKNIPLVGYLVAEACRRLSGLLERDEVASAGFLGLVSAASTFDPTQEVPFGAYARIRINGAIGDELRSLDWAGRGARQKIKRTRSAVDALTAQLGRVPTQEEIAGLLGVDTRTVRQSIADDGRKVFSLEPGMDWPEDAAYSPEAALVADEERRYLRMAVQALPPRIRYVVEQIYYEDRTVKEIAAETGKSHSAVSQDRTAGIGLLRESVSSYRGEDREVPCSRPGLSRKRMDEYLENVAHLLSDGIPA